MNETSKSRKFWGPLEHAVLMGSGIDIGCGPDPVTPTVRQFDVQDGDANYITRHVQGQFDFVYASHCLEHMHDARAAVLEWWQLVKPGGHLFFLVPDEDLYEQGVWPSRFNDDHKATFTIFKERSWSPVSINVRELAASLPGGELVSLIQQDNGYDRRLMRSGPDTPTSGWRRGLIRGYRRYRRSRFQPVGWMDRWLTRWVALDQTWRSGALAQIQCIVRKRA